eukprot:6848341-Lingulodinium_polyedra.AAC.1
MASYAPDPALAANIARWGADPAKQTRAHPKRKLGPRWRKVRPRRTCCCGPTGLAKQRAPLWPRMSEK